MPQSKPTSVDTRKVESESQRAAPTQPMAEPEAAMGGLWLASLMAGAESEQNCETSPAAELMSLEGRTAERITFGVDSGAALTVIGKAWQLSTQECRDSRDE